MQGGSMNVYEQTKVPNCANLFYANMKVNGAKLTALLTFPNSNKRSPASASMDANRSPTFLWLFSLPMVQPFWLGWSSTNYFFKHVWYGRFKLLKLWIWDPFDEITLPPKPKKSCLKKIVRGKGGEVPTIIAVMAS